MIFSLESGRAPISTTPGWKPELGFQQIISSPGNRCPIWNARGGAGASDLLLTSLGPRQLRQIRVASPPKQEHLLHSHRLLPQPGRPKSKLQNPNLPFGFWILDLGFWILDLGSWILDFGSWILDFAFWISDFGSWILDFGLKDFGFWDKVWILHKIIAITRRLGSADNQPHIHDFPYEYSSTIYNDLLPSSTSRDFASLLPPGASRCNAGINSKL